MLNRKTCPLHVCAVQGVWCVKTKSTFLRRHYIAFYIFVLEKVKWTCCHWRPFQALEGLYMAAPHSLTHAPTPIVFESFPIPLLSATICIGLLRWGRHQIDCEGWIWTLLSAKQKVELGYLKSHAVFKFEINTVWETRCTIWEHMHCQHNWLCNWQPNMALFQLYRDYSVNQNVI